MGLLSDMDKLDILNNGYNFLESGEYGYAKLQFQRYLDLYGYEQGVVERKAFCHVQLNEYKEAINCYDEILKHTQDQYALNNKGHLYNELGNPNMALSTLDLCTMFYPEYADGWSNKGRSLAALGRKDESLECYQKALQIDPYHTEANIGYEYLTNRRYVINDNYVPITETSQTSQTNIRDHTTNPRYYGDNKEKSSLNENSGSSFDNRNEWIECPNCGKLNNVGYIKSFGECFNCHAKISEDGELISKYTSGALGASIGSGLGSIAVFFRDHFGCLVGLILLIIMIVVYSII